mmetsp:Transcript_81490/g.157390  ORF Transcript_81490/g.157390 Transcript_81490/m.157390 type:complete len:116 (-) Transcript_81490:262-609(-)
MSSLLPALALQEIALKSQLQHYFPTHPQNHAQGILTKALGQLWEVLAVIQFPIGFSSRASSALAPAHVAELVFQKATRLIQPTLHHQTVICTLGKPQKFHQQREELGLTHQKPTV